MLFNRAAGLTLVCFLVHLSYTKPYARAFHTNIGSLAIITAVIVLVGGAMGRYESSRSVRAAVH